MQRWLDWIRGGRLRSAHRLLLLKTQSKSFIATNALALLTNNPIRSPPFAIWPSPSLCPSSTLCSLLPYLRIEKQTQIRRNWQQSNLTLTSNSDLSSFTKLHCKTPLPPLPPFHFPWKSPFSSVVSLSLFLTNSLFPNQSKPLPSPCQNLENVTGYAQKKLEIVINGTVLIISGLFLFRGERERECRKMAP